MTILAFFLAGPPCTLGFVTRRSLAGSGVEVVQRALDFGWTEMLTYTVAFHGQSSTECVEAVFAEPSVLAATGKYPLGQSPGIYNDDAFKK